MIEVVFFDAGETLLRPYPSFPELFADVCRRNGFPIEVEQVVKVQETVAPHLVELAKDSGVDLPSTSAEKSQLFWMHLYRGFLRELGIEDETLATRLFDVFSDLSSYKLFDDVIPVLAELGSLDLRLGVISNFEGWLADMLVELEVGHLFETIVISGPEGIEKPDPKLYEIAIERMRVDPSSAVHVGDSPAMDAAPAASVGMKPVLLDRYGRYPRAEWPTIATLKDLPELLPNL
jgi:putative hydrolase of the HAD superfamily